jgi:hypothetical protein
MVRRGSTVRVRQRALRDPAWLQGLRDGGRRAVSRNAQYGNGMETRHPFLPPRGIRTLSRRDEDRRTWPSSRQGDRPSSRSLPSPPEHRQCPSRASRTRADSATSRLDNALRSSQNQTAGTFYICRIDGRTRYWTDRTSGATCDASATSMAWSHVIVRPSSKAAVARGSPSLARAAPRSRSRHT